jgi:hypothetical protein
LKAIHKAPTYCLFLFFLLPGVSYAESLTGTVSNGTTGKPAAGDDVILLSLGQGMEEAGRTKTDAQGKFSLDLGGPAGPHLVRIVHQGVTYHRMAPPGTDSVDVQVFDVAKKIEGIKVAADLMYVQAKGNELGITRIFSVSNDSKPPRTQMNDHNLEFYLPEGAQIDGADAQTAGGQPVNSAPVPQAEKNRYAFIFPLRPGETQFQVTYRLPYSGTAQVDPKSIYPLQHFVVVMPRSMQFSPVEAGLFEEKQPPNQPDSMAEVAVNTKPGQKLSFSVSGAGMLADENASNAGPQEGVASAGSGASARDMRPGGGLGPPIDAPDPLEKYRWYILGGFAIVLAGGAVYIAQRPRLAGAGEVEEDVTLPAPSVAARPAVPVRPGMLLEALKEELFQLEVEHKQGRVSQEEYDKAKAALDSTLERALKREAQKTGS